MLSFSMPDGTGSVLDPACGGGTFLVRAYARAKSYDGTSQHQELLTRLFGIDVSPFPATIATVNLASRSLTFDDNYPRVIARTLFAVEPSLTDPLLRLPAPHSTNLDGETVPVLLDTVEAVVCNPPYVRLKDLGAARKAEASLALRRPHRRIPIPNKLTGSANYHLYFWFHAGQFLAPSGRLAFITASEWMDSDYGGQLQIWLLNNFKINVVIRSLAETWFEDARVGTVVLVAERCADGEARENNLVRFITLRQSLEDLYERIVVPDTQRIAAVDRLRDRLLAVSTRVGEGDDFDWSVVSQRELRALGSR
jgi:type I restriction-modification system DNA methylase subunit